MKRLILAGLAVLSSCALSSAQTLGTGAYPFSTFDSRGFDSINLGNNNVRFGIPVVSRTGRGLPFSYVLQYEGLVWSPTITGSTTVWTADPNWGFTGQLNGTAFGGYLTHNTGGGSCGSDGQDRGSGSGTYYTLSNFSYHDPYGAVHAFSYQYVSACSDGSTNPQEFGATSATDGSGYALINYGEQVQSRSGVTVTPGSSATIASSESETDSNGNEITFNGSGSFTDTLGVTALTISGSGPVTFTYPVALQANGATTAAANLYYKAYTVRTNFQCSGIVEYGSNTVNLVDHVTLADGSTYTFSYEGTPGASDGAVTARLGSVTLPTGGLISYAYPVAAATVQAASTMTVLPA